MRYISFLASVNHNPYTKRAIYFPNKVRTYWHNPELIINTCMLSAIIYVTYNYTIIVITFIPFGLQSSEISSMSKNPYVGVMGAYLARKYLSSSSVLTQEDLQMAGVSHYEPLHA